MMIGTGEIFNRFATVNAIGATIKTVATLSTKAEMIPANKAKLTMTHLTSGILSKITSAIFSGIRDWQKR
ncbi:MAG: hypothetical protein BWY58_01569 [Chloroflexi bacterium ADurb.Bin344]|nr:MAG: hypothetical protein BWY58_01569 [Chloroflexi bacterium ADurb.Bin344]